MQILLNESNEIISYATIGGFENGIEINGNLIPNGFTSDFQPQKYKFIEDKIVLNNNFRDNNDLYTEIQNHKEPSFDNSTLKLMVSTMQKQSVQSNMKMSRILKENIDLKNRVSELENIGVLSNE